MYGKGSCGKGPSGESWLTFWERHKRRKEFLRELSSVLIFNTQAIKGMLRKNIKNHSVQFSRSVLSDSATPWISTPDLPVHHQLPEFTQTHIHRVSDAIQPSHPLSAPSPPAPNPSQHQGLFQWVNSPHEVAKALEFQLQHQSFQWTPRNDL